MRKAAPQASRQEFRPREILFTLLAVSGALAGVLLVLELGLRTFLPQVDAERWFESNPRYGHVLKKNFSQRYRYPDAGVEIEVKTNSLGLRDREYDFNRPDLKRVVLLGDSFTFGEGLNAEDNFDSRLEALLMQWQENYIVLNTGVGGWGTVQETLYAVDHFAVLRPDVIVLTFCGNDPSDDVAFSQRTVDNERGRLPFPGKIFLRDHSHLYRYVYYTLTKLQHIRKMKQKKLEHPELVLDGQSSTLISEAEWSRTLQRIREFHRQFLTFNPNGILLVQSTYPHNESIQVHLRSLTNDTNLVYVDLYDAVVHLGLEHLRLPYDGHWTPEVHELSAQALFATIQRLETVRTSRNGAHLTSVR